MIGVKRYVVGFMFDETLTKVVLIRKLRPEWQNGLLNGVGGKVEENESPYLAMTREFREETGVGVVVDGQTVIDTTWKLFLIYNGGDAGIPGSLYEIYFYWKVGNVTEPKSMTDEPIVLVNVESLTSRTDTIPNVRWLVQMARSMSMGEKALYFDLQERHVWQD